MTVTKVFKFSAAHRLPNDPGPCKRLHGHTYTVEVTAEGPVDDEGMVIHFDSLKTAWAKLEPLLDHQTLNDTLPPAAQPPTTEHVAGWLLDRLHRHDSRISEVTLWEGPGARATARLAASPE